MKRVILFALIPFAAVYAAGPHVAPDLRIAVFLSFDNIPSDLSVDAMKQEAGGMLRDAGLALDWRFLEENRGTDAFDDLAVMRFKGSCRADSAVTSKKAQRGVLMNSEPPGKAVLAFTSVLDGRVLPFSEVECDRIREYIAPLESGNARERERIYGRVLGRVVAHELYHVLAQTAHHAGRGAAKSAHTARELASGKFSFSAIDESGLRHRPHAAR